MRSSISRRHRRAVALVWVAVTGLVLIGIAGLASDSAMLYMAGQQLQSAADSAALAGARVIRYSTNQARDAAVQLASANQVVNAPVTLHRRDDITTGYYDITRGRFYPEGNKSADGTSESLKCINAVKVVAHRRSLPLLFGPAFGTSTADLARTAIAFAQKPEGDGMIILNTTQSCSLHVQGNASLEVRNSDGDIEDIQVNSSSGSAACANGQPFIDADLNIHGGSNLGNSGVSGTVTCNAPMKPDPLAGVPAVTSRSPVRTCKPTQTQAQPGYYPQGISRTGNTSLSMSPGIYVLDGVGFQVNGKASIDARRVMLYIVGSGSLDLSGTGNVILTPTDIAPYEGITIFQARDNTNSAIITGTSKLNLRGVLYFPANHLDLTGTGTIVANQIVADTLAVSGTGDFVVNYTGTYLYGDYKPTLVQ